MHETQYIIHFYKEQLKRERKALPDKDIKEFPSFKCLMRLTKNNVKMDDVVPMVQE